jgi:putative intracellular protease/amidase
MNWRLIRWTGLGVVALSAVIGGAWMLSLPSAPAMANAPPIASGEAEATVNALKPTKRQRPLIAIVGVNDATEATDYLVPYGILRRSGVADVMLLATEPGPVQLYPAAIRVEPQAPTAEFDAEHPEGADLVIVPAMTRDDDAAVMEWLKSQAAKGAKTIGVCAGAKVVAAAGLLDGKRATTHWYYVDEMLDKHPEIHYVADRRMVVDEGVATTTGITASMPVSLTLIEAIAGRDAAETVAMDLGVMNWDARHDSDAFQLTRPFALTAIRNTVAFWNREELGMELTPGVDEVSLALFADAWSRTYRSRVLTFSRTGDAVESRGGIRILPDRATATSSDHALPPIDEMPPAIALDEALKGITARYGTRTADLVATLLEYPWEVGSP